jgi:hypothetical protein
MWKQFIIFVVSVMLPLFHFNLARLGNTWFCKCCILHTVIFVVYHRIKSLFLDSYHSYICKLTFLLPQNFLLLFVPEPFWFCEWRVVASLWGSGWVSRGIWIEQYYWLLAKQHILLTFHAISYVLNTACSFGGNKATTSYCNLSVGECRNYWSLLRS